MTNQVITAFQIAMKAHEGQTDKAGMPYILHPLTVAAEQETEDAFIAGLLHDVVEDSNYTFDDLRRAGIAEHIVEALTLLTHDKDIDYLAYVAKLKSSPIAASVKLADLRHNSDLARLPEVNAKDIERAEKYRLAIGCLTALDEEQTSGGSPEEQPD